MRIHITTTAPELAAVEIMQHMEAHGGEWIVNAVEDEGYVMARGPHARQLMRSGSPAIVEAITADWALAKLAGHLKMARARSKALGPRSAGPAPRSTVGRPAGEAANIIGRVRECVSRRYVTTRDVADELGIPTRAASRALFALKARKEVKVVERIARHVGHEYVYGAAA